MALDHAARSAGLLREERGDRLLGKRPQGEAGAQGREQDKVQVAAVPLAHRFQAAFVFALLAAVQGLWLGILGYGLYLLVA
jgi:hypothetical protein